MAGKKLPKGLLLNFWALCDLLETSKNFETNFPNCFYLFPTAGTVEEKT